MALSDDERRKRERERKRRYRAQQKAKPNLVALPQLPPDPPSQGGTEDGTAGGTDGRAEYAGLTNLAAALDALAELEIPTMAKPLAALVVRLARDLDAALNVPQRASLTSRYLEAFDKLNAVARTKEPDELDAMRRAFYTGGRFDADDAEDEAPQGRGAQQA